MSTNHFNGLSEAEAERLALLAEECGEVIQAVSKVLHHGYESRNPKVPFSLRNRDLLANELGHVMHAMQRMIEARDFRQLDLELSQNEKSRSIGQWLHHQADLSIRCTGCQQPKGSQHKPSCVRQGIVSEDSDYRDRSSQ